MATRTLNQIRAEIVAFAVDHGQLWTVKFGRQAELLAGGTNVKFPAFYYDLQNARKADNVMQMTFQGWVLDKLLPDLTNADEIYNDTLLIGSDILGYLSNDDRDYELQDGVTFTPMNDETGDRLAGVSFSFTLLVPFPYNRCITPVKPRGYLMTENGEILGTENGAAIGINPEESVATEDNFSLTTENGELLT